MPKLPTANNLQRAQVVDQSAPLRRQVVDDGLRTVAKGMEEGAKALGVMAERQLQAEISDAESDFLIKRQELESDYRLNKDKHEDYRTLNKRFNDDLNKIAEESIGMIGSKRAQERFRTDVVGVQSGQANIRMEEFAFGLAKDDSVAKMTDTQAKLRDAFISGSDEDKLRSIELLDQGIQTRLDLGYIDEGQAEQLSREAKQSWAVGAIEAADPADRLAMLDQDHIRKNIPDDTEAKLRRQAETDNNNLIAQTAVDGYMDQGLDRKESLKMIREQYGDQPEVRAAAEKRLDYVMAQETQAKNEAESEAVDAAEEHIMGGGSVADLDDSTKSALGTKGVEALEAVELKMLNGHPVVTVTATHYELVEMATQEPKKFSALNLMEYRDKLSQSDFKQLASAQSSIRSGKGGEGEYGSLKGLRNRNQVVDGVMKAAGIDPNKKPEEAAEFRSYMNDQLVQYQLDNDGKVPGPTEWERMTNESFIKLSQVNPWYRPNKDVRAFQANPSMRFEMDVDDIPEKDLMQIKEALRIKGTAETDDNIVKMYTKGLELSVGAE